MDREVVGRGYAAAAAARAAGWKERRLRAVGVVVVAVVLAGWE